MHQHLYANCTSRDIADIDAPDVMVMLSIFYHVQSGEVALSV